MSASPGSRPNPPSNAHRSTNTRIVIADNFHWRRYGRVRVDTSIKLYHGLIRGNYKVCPFSDRDVARFESLFKTRHLGAGVCNRKLIETCENFQPEVLLLGHAEIITNDTLRKIRSLLPGVRIGYRFGDALWIPQNFRKASHRVGHVDVLFVAEANAEARSLAKSGTKVCWIPHPVDACVESLRNFERAQFDTDLVFCGIGNTTDPRYALVGDLLENLVDVRFSVHGMHGRPPVLGVEYDRKLEASKMGLSLNRREVGDLSSSDRIAQLLGNGLLTFADRACGYDYFFSDDEVIFYSTRDELVRLIRQYNGDDAQRRSVAENGWLAYHEHFGAQKVAQYMVETVLDCAKLEHYPWAEFSFEES